jgi:hypothetical protein
VSAICHSIAAADDVVRFAARYLQGNDDIKKSIDIFAGEKLLCSRSQLVKTSFIN